jgi:hypothetical protein
MFRLYKSPLRDPHSRELVGGGGEGVIRGPGPKSAQKRELERHLKKFFFYLNYNISYKSTNLYKSENISKLI